MTYAARNLLGMVCALLASAGSAYAQEHHHHAAPPPTCADVSMACADKATPFLQSDGTLWLAWSANGRVAVVTSRDMGRSFSAPSFVNSAAEKLDAGADSRPQIVRDPSGRVVVAYTIARDANYNGQVLTASSADGVKAFGAPQPLTLSDASQRFVAFALDPAGDVFAAWIDKRNLVAAKAAHKKYNGAALAFAWAGSGKNFAPAAIAHDNTCECCRVGVAFAGPHRPVVIWRNLFAGGVRDHAVMTINGDQPGPVMRVAEDNWKIDACPHHGPALAVSPSGTYHAAWFTEGSNRQGLFYARSADAGVTFGKPLAIGQEDRQPSRPMVFSTQHAVWLAWKEFDGTRSLAVTMVSHDDGMSWSKPKVVAETTEASDHPLMVGSGEHVFLSWLTRKEGYRLIALGTP